MDTKFITVNQAREHNLRNVSVKIPKNKFVVITGPSGSGKSSLAFDTVYAEGQRRYVESLSAYARQFLNLQNKPDVESIEGLSPAIAIDQKTTSKNPRSTVSTATEIYDYMRLLFARIGVPISPATGKPIESQSASDMIERIRKIPNDTKVYILAPIVRGQKGEHRKELAQIRKQGFQRLKIDGEIFETDDLPTIEKNKKHHMEVVVDRLVITEDLDNRLADSVETALRLTDGLLHVEIVGLPEDYTGDDFKNEQIITFSEKFSCPISGFTIDEIEPRLLSFNSPYGACESCNGLGTEYYFDPNLVVANEDLSISEGAIAPWKAINSKYYTQTLLSLSKFYDFDLDTAFRKLPNKTQQIILYGSGDEEVRFEYHDGYKNQIFTKPFEGVIPYLERKVNEADSDWVLEECEKYQNITKCRACSGFRLRPESLSIQIAGSHIGNVTALTIEQAVDWFNNLPTKLNNQENQIAERALKEITRRLGFLKNVGLEYLTLDRHSGTLSGGESQRIRLASQIGSGLSGVMYILDEPSIGLHQSDNSRLIATLKDLRDLGNTVIVVEHDEETMESADHVIDVGPGAGVYGGEIIAEGTPDDIKQNENSITGKYLTGIEYIAIPEERRKARENRAISIINAHSNNLKNITCSIPIGLFTAVTGVSGGGKSTLIIQTLYKALAKKLNGAKAKPGLHDEIKGTQYIDKIIEIDQSPIGRTPRSNPATYTGAFTAIRDWYVGLPESKARGYKAGRFSFNVKGGRCENCQGDGLIKIEMHFLPDVYVICDTCKGARYNKETIEIKYRGKSIADILNMTVEEALLFFRKMPLIRDKFEALYEVGLGYMKIGQSATTLSGGEAQRVKLAKELCKKATGRTLYILDEPTTGLHSNDIKKLLKVLHRLVESGNTVLVIEHNMDVIKTADWIVDIGPKGGDKGGIIVAEGTPEEVANVKESITGHYLTKYLNKAKKIKKSA
ncbi:MAG: excinuclease ABC subunit UvrA [Alphaproteobacteria bacterium]|jgi:excinuclease ABC subunit A|nr:excinuclease ABC subunit UvrA [Alphaproteobacteria bacterium]MBT5828096.1 excinuclease ABC subunit UvrA [Alphaproteobacteria bacterium]